MRTRFPAGVLLSALLATAAGGAAKAQTGPVEHRYDVVLHASDAPARGSRFVFALVNGDTLPNNTATIESLTTDGHLGSAVATMGKAGGETASGFWLDEGGIQAASRWIQQDASVEEQLSFRLRVTKEYPAGQAGIQPDQFSFAVLESGSSAGYLTSDDPTTANALFTLDLRPGSTPKLYHPGPGRPADAWNVTVTAVPEPGALAGAGAAFSALLGLRRRLR